MKSKVLNVIIGVSLLVISLFISIPEIQEMYNDISGIKSFNDIKEGKYILDFSNNADLSDESRFNKKIADKFFEELNKEFKSSIEFRFLPVIINKKEVQYVFVNKDFFYDHSFEYFKGNGFSVSSFSKDNNLDIIVGYNIKDAYNLGSNNVIETMGERFNTEVISILEKGSFYHSITKNHFDLDSAIIIPFDVDFAKKHFKYPEYLMSYQNMIISTNREESLKNLFKKDNAVLNIDVKSLEEAVGETDIFNIDDLFKLLIILSIILTPILIILCFNELYQNKIFMLIIAIINSIVLVKYIAILLSQSKVNFGTVNAYVLIINLVGLYISFKILNNKLKTK